MCLSELQLHWALARSHKMFCAGLLKRNFNYLIENWLFSPSIWKSKSVSAVQWWFLPSWRAKCPAVGLRCCSVHKLPSQWGVHISCHDVSWLQTLSLQRCFVNGIWSRTNVLKWKPRFWAWKWSTELLFGTWFRFKSNHRVGWCVWGWLAGAAGIRKWRLLQHCLPA